MSKIAFITGASSGIGHAVALEFSGRGYNLVLCARRTDRLIALESLIKKQHPKVATLAISCDVRDPKSLQEAVRQAKEKFGKIDIVYANAGYGVAGRFERLKVEDFRNQFETNVFGVLNTIYATLADIKESKGQLVLMGSANSYVAEPKKSPYCMSKFAIKALADSLRWELKPLGVSVTLICPGMVDSEIRRVDNQGNFHSDAKDPAPKRLILSAEKAAHQIVDAIESRKKEKLITFHGALAVLAQRFAPSLLTPILKQGKSVSRK